VSPVFVIDGTEADPSPTDTLVNVAVVALRAPEMLADVAVIAPKELADKEPTVAVVAFSVDTVSPSPSAPCWKFLICAISSRMALLMLDGAQPSLMLILPMSVLLAAVLEYSDILSFDIYFSSSIPSSNR